MLFASLPIEKGAKGTAGELSSCDEQDAEKKAKKFSESLKIRPRRNPGDNSDHLPKLPLVDLVDCSTAGACVSPLSVNAARESADAWPPTMDIFRYSRNSLSLVKSCAAKRTAATLYAAVVLLLGAHRDTQAGEAYHLASPDKRIQLTVEFPAAGSSEGPRWSAAFRGKPVLANCRLGLQTADVGDLMAGVRVIRARERSANRRVRVLFGKSDRANDRFREIRLALKTRQGQRTDVMFRCYDDAIALRYEMLAESPARSVTVTEETTSFRVAGEPTAYAQFLENFKTSHEHEVVPTRYSDLKRGPLLDLPLTLSWADGTYAAITEAALRHYAGMSLMRSLEPSTADELVCRLTPRADGAKVVRQLPMRTPWRVVLLGDRPGALLESQTLYCLNESSKIRDTSWIKPGKITFHWWNGDVYDGQPGPPALSLEMAKKYIDFCAREGIPTHSITSTEGVTTPWYHQSQKGVEPGPDTDVTRLRAGFDLAAIRAYAASKNVRLWTWVHQAALRGKVDEAFAAFEKMGWSGMMVDFFDHDDQEHVEFAEEILQAAARHRIMIHLHGVWKPTGLERTYPNLMNHEGALNLEYLKWSGRCTPEHDLMMAFTRLIAGPMDYHLGGFRAVTRANFKPQHVAPNVLGTRCHQLAMYVCYDNANPMVADYPTAYQGQPGFDFLKLVPTWWDKTRVLVGEIGELLVTARRKGKTWYLGGLASKGPRELTLPLSFLGAGRYRARIWKDANDSETNPNLLAIENLRVSSNDKLKVRIALDGGFVAQLTPIN
ncbi:MAG: glycoside hydrolase family 97 protein, partial [Verrucomicrobia bacterium]|nr:glycoside hydrolase family 97 protein [Verrucomicrobiota bacterium]